MHFTWQLHPQYDAYVISSLPAELIEFNTGVYHGLHVLPTGGGGIYGRIMLFVASAAWTRRLHAYLYVCLCLSSVVVHSDPCVLR